MKLKFEKLPHQTKAVENILSVFKDLAFFCLNIDLKQPFNFLHFVC